MKLFCHFFNLFLLYHSSLSVLQPARKHAAADVITAVDAGVLQSVNSADQAKKR